MLKNRNIFPISFVLLAFLLTSCQPNAEPPFAKIVPSAEVEVRDGPTPVELERQTRVVVLGTGTPIPDAHRGGASIAVVHKGQAYLFDVGAGAIRNATIARYKYDIPSLYPSLICCLFLTHLHSDHIIDYPELVATLWWRRKTPFSAWGPNGLSQMTNGVYQMLAADIALRQAGTGPVEIGDSYKVDVTEIDDGFVFERDGMRIEAFRVNHGAIKPAFGFRITTSDKSIVISGDTAYSDKLVEMSRGVDLLFHEVISDSGLSRARPDYQVYHRQAHTTATELARLAGEARPELLVLYHPLLYGVPEATVVDEVKETYDGEVVLANDLDIF